jgi:hypothetical protein
MGEHVLHRMQGSPQVVQGIAALAATQCLDHRVALVLEPLGTGTQLTVVHVGRRHMGFRQIRVIAGISRLVGGVLIKALLTQHLSGDVIMDAHLERPGRRAGTDSECGCDQEGK